MGFSKENVRFAYIKFKTKFFIVVILKSDNMKSKFQK